MSLPGLHSRVRHLQRQLAAASLKGIRNRRLRRLSNAINGLTLRIETLKGLT